MSVVDTTERTLQVKIVYYGPGLSGKTTNLEQLSQQLNPQRRGDLMVLDTVGDRTLFFDWMPVDLGTIRGFDVKIQLYTVPGQVRYNNTRKRVLAGVDGIVFVADSQAEALDQNEFSLLNLRENLEELGIRLEDIPLVIQYNKRDLPSALPIEDLAEHLDLEEYPAVESVAAKGKGVLETLRLITRLTLQAVKDELDPNRARQKHSDVPMDGQALLEELMKGDGDEGRGGVETGHDLSEAGGDPATEGPAEEHVGEYAEEHIEMEAELPDEAASHGESGSESFHSQEVVLGGGRSDQGEVTGEDPGASFAADAQAGASTPPTSSFADAPSLPADLIQRMAALEGLVAGLDHRLDELAQRTSRESEFGPEVLHLNESLARIASDMDAMEKKLDMVQRVASSLGGKTAAVEMRVDRLERSDNDPVRAEHLLRLSRLFTTLSDALVEYASLLRPKSETVGEPGTDDSGQSPGGSSS